MENCNSNTRAQGVPEQNLVRSESDSISGTRADERSTMVDNQLSSVVQWSELDIFTRLTSMSQDRVGRVEESLQELWVAHRKAVLNHASMVNGCQKDIHEHAAAIRRLQQAWSNMTDLATERYTEHDSVLTAQARRVDKIVTDLCLMTSQLQNLREQVNSESPMVEIANIQTCVDENDRRLDASEGRLGVLEASYASILRKHGDLASELMALKEAVQLYDPRPVVERITKLGLQIQDQVAAQQQSLERLDAAVHAMKNRVRAVEDTRPSQYMARLHEMDSDLKKYDAWTGDLSKRVEALERRSQPDRPWFSFSGASAKVQDYHAVPPPAQRSPSDRSGLGYSERETRTSLGSRVFFFLLLGLCIFAQFRMTYGSAMFSCAPACENHTGVDARWDCFVACANKTTSNFSCVHYCADQPDPDNCFMDCVKARERWTKLLAREASDFASAPNVPPMCELPGMNETVGCVKPPPVVEAMGNMTTVDSLLCDLDNEMCYNTTQLIVTVMRIAATRNFTVPVHTIRCNHNKTNCLKLIFEWYKPLYDQLHVVHVDNAVKYETVRFALFDGWDGLTYEAYEEWAMEFSATYLNPAANRSQDLWTSLRGVFRSGGDAAHFMLCMRELLFATMDFLGYAAMVLSQAAIANVKYIFAAIFWSCIGHKLKVSPWNVGITVLTGYLAGPWGSVGLAVRTLMRWYFHIRVPVYYDTIFLLSLIGPLWLTVSWSIFSLISILWTHRNSVVVATESLTGSVPWWLFNAILVRWCWPLVPMWMWTLFGIIYAVDLVRRCIWPYYQTHDMPVITPIEQDLKRPGKKTQIVSNNQNFRTINIYDDFDVWLVKWFGDPHAVWLPYLDYYVAANSIKLKRVEHRKLEWTAPGGSDYSGQALVVETHARLVDWYETEHNWSRQEWNRLVAKEARFGEFPIWKVPDLPVVGEIYFDGKWCGNFFKVASYYVTAAHCFEYEFVTPGSTYQHYTLGVKSNKQMFTVPAQLLACYDEDIIVLNGQGRSALPLHTLSASTPSQEEAPLLIYQWLKGEYYFSVGKYFALPPPSRVRHWCSTDFGTSGAACCQTRGQDGALSVIGVHQCRVGNIFNLFVAFSPELLQGFKSGQLPPSTAIGDGQLVLRPPEPNQPVDYQAKKVSFVEKVAPKKREPDVDDLDPTLSYDIDGVVWAGNGMSPDMLKYSVNGPLGGKPDREDSWSGQQKKKKGLVPTIQSQEAKKPDNELVQLVKSSMAASESNFRDLNTSLNTRFEAVGLKINALESRMKQELLDQGNKVKDVGEKVAVLGSMKQTLDDLELAQGTTASEVTDLIQQQKAILGLVKGLELQVKSERKHAETLASSFTKKKKSGNEKALAEMRKQLEESVAAKTPGPKSCNKCGATFPSMADLKANHLPCKYRKGKA